MEHSTRRRRENHTEHQRQQDMYVRHEKMKVNLQQLLTWTLSLLLLTQTIHSHESTPIPSPWPERFHSLLYMNLSSGHLQITDLWYDWPKGRNVNIMQKQLGDLVFDVEWNNGTSFYFTRGAQGRCRTMKFEVGIPRPDFLDGAIYLGRESTDGFLCNVWEKVEFIWYYEDVLTKRPVRWDFYDGISTHVMTFEVGAILPDVVVQAPAYCFNQENGIKMLLPSELVTSNKNSLLHLHT